MTHLDEATRIADAVLLEGYLLYPYRASSAKNQYRWTFGVVAPRVWSDAGGCEPWQLEARALVAGEPSALTVRLRFLSIVTRRIERKDGSDFEPVSELRVDNELHVPFEEGQLCSYEISGLADAEYPIKVTGFESIHPLRDRYGVVRGRMVRVQTPLCGRVRVRREVLPVPPGAEALSRLTVTIENLSERVRRTAHRAEAMTSSWASTHLLLAAEGARFVSLLDPPPHARRAAAECQPKPDGNEARMWTVVSGEDGKDDVAIASTLILSDYPQIAPESPGDFCDACEIDELLALRTRTLTPEEKALVRATDARGRAILERSERLTDDDMARLHGTRRAALVPGVRVTLRPDGQRRRSDAQDFLYDGMSATIRAVKKDVDGRDFFGVTIDADPAAALHEARGVFRYYYRDELEPA